MHHLLILHISEAGNYSHMAIIIIFLFCDEKDNHGFLKYVCAQLSINLATFLALETIFATHSDLFIICSDSGEKYLVLTYVTRTLGLFFSSPLCYVGRLSVVFIYLNSGYKMGRKAAS